MTRTTTTIATSLSRTAAMAGTYLTFLKRRFPSIKFQPDSRFSWLMSVVASLYIFNTIGIVHCLGVFFKPWMDKYQVTEASLIWIQSAYYACNMIFGPLVAGLVKVAPGQLLVVIASVVSCIAHVLTAFVGKSLRK